MSRPWASCMFSWWWGGWASTDTGICCDFISDCRCIRNHGINACTNNRLHAQPAFEQNLFPCFNLMRYIVPRLSMYGWRCASWTVRMSRECMNLSVKSNWLHICMKQIDVHSNRRTHQECPSYNYQGNNRICTQIAERRDGEKEHQSYQPKRQTLKGIAWDD